MRIILTGPNCFSGKVVLASLLEQGHDITVISRSPISSPLLARVSHIHGDLSTIKSLSGEYHAIVHIAATSPNSQVTNENMINDNLFATANLIRLGRLTGVSKFIFFSSISVYGDILQTEVFESTPINNPCIYGMSKLLCESMLREQTDFKTIAIRLPAIIGFGAARHWLALIIDMFKQNKEVTIYNPKAMFNNAVHIQNLATFVCHLLNSELSKDFDYMNVASIGGLDIFSIANQIKTTFGSSSNITIAPAKKLSFTISNDYAMKKYLFKPLDFSKALTNYLQEHVSLLEAYQPPAICVNV